MGIAPAFEHVRDWAIYFRAELEFHAKEKFPGDVQSWPLLKAFDAKGYVWSETYLVVVLKDKLLGIPVIGGPEVLEDASAPNEAPTEENADAWFTYLVTKFEVRPQDAAFIIPVTDDVNTPKQWKKWSDANRALWLRQMEMNLTRHYYNLKGFDLIGDFIIPVGYQFLADECQRFFEDHPQYDKNVFIMTRLEGGERLLESLDKELRGVLRQQGLDPVRADDKMYLRDRNLWNNVCLHMICCKQGIAILEDRIEYQFNPNVALEYGFMRALNKPTLLLKDVAFRNLRADIMGTLWEEFDITDIEGTIRTPVEKWLRELGHL